MKRRTANGRNAAPAVAALHRDGDRWRGVILKRGDQWQVAEARTFDDSGLAAFAQTAVELGADRLCRLIPARETVCRVAQVPAGDDSQVLAAAALLAEAELPATIPAHRRAVGLLPGAESVGTTAVLLTAWVGNGPPANASDLPELWTTPIAALALLRSAGDHPVIYAERGAVSAIVPGSTRTIARVSIEDSVDSDAAPDPAASLADTAAAAGASLDLDRITETFRDGRRLYLPPGDVAALRAQVSGIPEVQEWLDEYALAIGAALCITDPRPAVRSLATILAVAPVKEHSAVESASLWLAKPSHAWTVLAAAVVLMLLGPLGFAFGRLAVLEARTSKLANVRGNRDNLERTAALYDQLEISRWPMTKLMADISSATPVGVVVTNLRLSSEQGIAIQGTAESSELVNSLQANLNKTRLFRDIKINRVESKSESEFEFDVTADVSQAHAAAQPVDDFAARPLAVRLYGEGASNTAAPADSDDRPSSRRNGAERPRPNGDRGGERNGDRDAETTRRPPPPAGPPPVLTDADIAKMTHSVAMNEFGKRRNYVQKNSGLDAATKQRLNEEAEKLRARMAAASSGGGT